MTQSHWAHCDLEYVEDQGQHDGMEKASNDNDDDAAIGQTMEDDDTGQVHADQIMVTVSRSW